MTPAQPLVRALGVLESCFKEKFGTPRQPRLVPSATARLRVRKEFIPEQSLKGLSEFSHVWLLSWFHLNTNKAFKSTVHPPRLQGGTVGVFASRSPHRPSPIGLSVVKLERVEGDTLYFSHIDLVDGTPILDVKPYIPSYDCLPGARAGWTERAGEPEFSVEFEPAAAAEAQRRGLRALIEDVLRYDSRNPRDRSQLKAGKELEVFLGDWDVRFRVEGARVLVTAVEPAKAWKKARRVEPPSALF